MINETIEPTPSLELLEEKRKDVENYRAILARYAQKNNSRWYHLGRDELQKREQELRLLEEAFAKANPIILPKSPGNP